jgi:predicted aspartyl protease
MRVVRFDPARDLIFVDGMGWSPRANAQRELHLVLDTGAAGTIVIPEVLDELGYSPRDGEQITTMRSAVGREQGYLTRVARLSCLGHREDDFRVHVQDLPEGGTSRA